MCISSRRARPCGRGSRQPSPSSAATITWHDSFEDVARRVRCCSSPTSSSMRCRSANSWRPSAAGASGLWASTETRLIFGLNPEPEPALGAPPTPGRDPRSPSGVAVDLTGELAGPPRARRRRGPHHRLRLLGAGLRRHPAGGEAPRLRRSAGRAGRSRSHDPCGFLAARLRGPCSRRRRSRRRHAGELPACARHRSTRGAR